jgi:SAM-dependent methyltransferase
LQRAGVLRALSEGRSVSRIARTCGFDSDMLTDLLDFVTLRSTLVRRTGRGRQKRYTIASGGRNSSFAHLLDQYVGAYGPCLFDLARVLKRPAIGGRLVDRKRHASAFSGADPAPELVRLIETLGFRVLLDIGCGGGQLLAALARRRPLLRGIGLDANPAMVKSARRRVSEQRLADRVKILRCDFRDLGRVMSERRRKTIDGICAISVADGFFAPDSVRDIYYFFRQLRSLFANRILVLCDYYSALRGPRRPGENLKRTLVHDVAQLVSTQGIPPKDLREWQTIYARASVKLLLAYRRTDHGVSWFIHLVQL